MGYLILTKSNYENPGLLTKPIILGNPEYCLIQGYFVTH